MRPRWFLLPQTASRPQALTTEESSGTLAGLSQRSWADRSPSCMTSSWACAESDILTPVQQQGSRLWPAVEGSKLDSPHGSVQAGHAQPLSRRGGLLMGHAAQRTGEPHLCAVWCQLWEDKRRVALRFSVHIREAASR